jgi:hypothetical protein
MNATISRTPHRAPAFLAEPSEIRPSEAIPTVLVSVESSRSLNPPQRLQWVRKGHCKDSLLVSVAFPNGNCVRIEM